MGQRWVKREIQPISIELCLADLRFKIGDCLWIQTDRLLGRILPNTPALQAIFPEAVKLLFRIDAAVDLLPLIPEIVIKVTPGKSSGHLFSHLLSYRDEKITQVFCIKEWPHGRLHEATDTLLRQVITPALKSSVVRQNEMGLGCGFIHKARNGHDERDLFQRVGKASTTGKRKEWIHVVKKESLNPSLRHGLSEGEEIPVGGELSHIARRAKANGFPHIPCDVIQQADRTRCCRGVSTAACDTSTQRQGRPLSGKISGQLDNLLFGKLGSTGHCLWIVWLDQGADLCQFTLR